MFIKGVFRLESFKTIKGEASSEFTEKRSRFICYAKHVLSKEEAEDYIKHIKSIHWDAKHNVYAYRIREENISKASDDGEPQGSGGIPVISVLEKKGLFDIVVVITRYFGGVLLGIGGLSRAYSYGAKLAVGSSEIISMVLCTVVQVFVGYDVFEKIKRAIRRFHAKISDCTYTNNVEAYIHIYEDEYPKFEEFINEMDFGNIKIEVKSREFCCIDQEKVL